MTLDDLKALAVKAKAWRPKVCERVFDQTNGEMAPCHGCDRCHGARRACEDIAENVTLAMAWVTGNNPPCDPRGLGESCARDAVRVASYFGPESNPVAEFAKAVKEFCSDGG